jgi:phage tail-like protein
VGATDGTNIGMANRFAVKVVEPSAFDLGTWAKCDGLDVSWNVNSYQAGDAGNSLWIFPGSTKYKDVTLQRVACTDTKRIKDDWLSKVSFELSTTLKPHLITVTLLDESYTLANAVCDWELQNAFPKQWSVTGMDATKSAVAFETLVIAHTGFLGDEVSI